MKTSSVEARHEQTVADYLADFEDTKLSPADKSRLDWGLTQGP